MTADPPPTDPSPRHPPPPRERLLAALRASLADGTFVKLVFARPRGSGSLRRIDARRILLRSVPHLSFVRHYPTRDETSNAPLPAAIADAEALIGAPFQSVHLFTRDTEWQLRLGKRGSAHLTTSALAAPAGAAGEAHDRGRHRLVDPGRPFLHELGVTTAAGQVVPSMAKKYRQIDKFVELFAGAVGGALLATDLRVVDFGAGKGYLTFAVHDWLLASGSTMDVAGVERRADLVADGNARVERLGLRGLRFVQGEVATWPPGSLDVLIALHACDVATDHALHLGVRSGARVILCAPCCHKEVRPQLQPPAPLQAVLRHGVHLEREATLLTDGLRALLLEAAGYDVQVFEFVPIEHTAKNTMLLARRRAAPRAAEGPLAEVAALKAFYGVRELTLERLLAGGGGGGDGRVR
ncbi:MAG: SAM-dependent methyltransferase [Planctomycetes bacterium]|nr:SAM-dependent methyltransferase [Planctomycetota bacterium]